MSGFVWLIKSTCFFIIPIGAMLAAALAAITSLQKIFLCKNDVALGAVIKIFGVEILAKHSANIA
jgi:hypothetical protein